MSSRERGKQSPAAASPAAESYRTLPMWSVIPAMVVAHALGLPQLWGASADACNIASLFFSTSLAFGAFIDQDALHSLFFYVQPAPKKSDEITGFTGFAGWMVVLNWIACLATLIFVLRICDPEYRFSDSASVDLTISIICMTYVDIVFGMAVAARRQARGEQPDMGLYLIAAGPAIVYAVFLIYAAARLNTSIIPLIVETNSWGVFALPLVHAAILSNNLVSLLPCMMVQGPAVEAKRAVNISHSENSMLPKITYVVISLALWWLTPPLKLATILKDAPSAIHTQWRNLTLPSAEVSMDDGLWHYLFGGSLYTPFITTLLVIVLARGPVGQGVKKTFDFLSSLKVSKKHDRIDAYNSQQDDSQTSVDERNDQYATLVDSYYDLATEFYEWGWGTSFHFADRRKDESFQDSIKRHEYYIAGRLGINGGAKILDCGCGVGGPARNIARFTGANITAVTINNYQVQRGNLLSERDGIRDQVELVQADFMKLPFPDASFDAVYAIESTCHAPDRNGVYSEILRVLKPGGIFACYEWCLTDKYDPNDEFHRKIKKDIEVGDGLPDLVHTSVCDKALAKVGFEVLEARDCALDGHLKGGEPWYMPLVPSWNPFAWPRFQFNPVMFVLMPKVLKFFETIGVVPDGTTKTQVMLQAGGVGCAQGGHIGCFTPMWLMVARKPK
eukprot:TRINITY_DN49975_c0_g1_i1.p1 TRINITY_DN49975_c0_g1~~TRINITY_DN49975_c0_g1_i1.p1  ORF type:complete len:675 (-),score=107.79 TRINITY_DN49975_c0_g1_i1:381-2405(-)